MGKPTRSALQIILILILYSTLTNEDNTNIIPPEPIEQNITISDPKIFSSEDIDDTSSSNEEQEQSNISIADEVGGKDDLVVSATLLKRILSPKIYDKTLRPRGLNGTGSPVKVQVSLFIRTIENIDDEKMEYKVQMTFRESWNDPRLKYSHIHPHIKYLTLTNSDNIWVPDIFFSNEKAGEQHQLMLPNFFGRIYSDGIILVSYRISLLLSCPMKLQYYPLDSQECPFKMASYGYTDKDMEINWRAFNTIQMATTIILPRFSLISHRTENCESITSTGNYDCIQLFFKLERQFGFYLIQIYAPCIMLVLISWVAFWLEPTATEARGSLAITTILAVVTQIDSINDQVPPASYIKAIDVWTFTIQFMVFGAILQFAYVNYVVHFEWKYICEHLDDGNDYLHENKSYVLKERSRKKAKKIDNICKICFPLVFGIFNMIYWSYYLKTPVDDI